MHMKKTYLYVALFGVLLSGCEDYLDKSPELGMTSDEVFRDYYSARGFLDEASFAVKNFHQSNQATNADPGWKSDEARHAVASQVNPVRRFNDGDWLNLNYMDMGWDYDKTESNAINSRHYTGAAMISFRIVNMFLENVHKMTVIPTETGYTPQELKDQLIGQAYFLRGFHYFQVILRRGGMPKFDRVFTSDEDLDFERLSYRESTDWLVSDLDSAIKYLPATWDSQNRGRPTKASAAAFKAMALLYDSSPLMNPNLGYNYDIDRCRLAADASVVALNIAESTYPYHRMFTWEEYFENFYSFTRVFPEETIYGPPNQRRHYNSNYRGTWNGWSLPVWDGGRDQCQYPTQNAVDWFETADGYAIEDAPPSSYDPQNPYINRDPRLNAFIYVNGADMYVNAPPSRVPRYLESWIGGYHYQNTTGEFTGYVHKKLRWPGNNPYDNFDPNTIHKMYPYIRYAQLYLDFAEAANEAYGPNGVVPGTQLTAVAAINIVRNRAGMPDVLPIYTNSKEVFRDRIRNERAVELYHENHRFHDIRRWRIAHEVLKNLYVLELIKDGDQLIFGKKLVDIPRVFDEKHYWYPFPTNQVEMLSRFKQNPGW
jgi:starch-binding outer membrane protein, SusD/RagB family